MEARALSVRCLKATPDGSLWIVTRVAEWARWTRAQLHRVSTAQGLHDDTFLRSWLTGQGRVWLTGNRGLFQVRLEELVAVAEGRSGHLSFDCIWAR